jgi:hypothetical protein
MGSRVTWFKLDDQFPNHPKVRKAGDAAAWLYVCGGCYCAQYLTDGFIPKVVVPSLTAIRKPLEQASMLVAFDLWHDRGDEFEVHDYLVYNPTRAKVEAEREAARLRAANGGKSSRKVRAKLPLASVTPVPVPDVLTEHPSGGCDLAPLVQSLVGGYVTDYGAERDNKRPPRAWVATAGKAVKAALEDDQPFDDIARCLGVIAHESKNPGTLAHVLADMHAGRERRIR